MRGGWEALFRRLQGPSWTKTETVIRPPLHIELRADESREKKCERHDTHSKSCYESKVVSRMWSLMGRSDLVERRGDHLYLDGLCDVGQEMLRRRFRIREVTAGFGVGLCGSHTFCAFRPLSSD
jgi:hypothetical protein